MRPIAIVGGRHGLRGAVFHSAPARPAHVAPRLRPLLLRQTYSTALVPDAVTRMRDGETSLVREVDPQHKDIRALVQAAKTDSLDLVR
jgi:hypothetical protein